MGSIWFKHATKEGAYDPVGQRLSAKVTGNGHLGQMGDGDSYVMFSLATQEEKEATTGLAQSDTLDQQREVCRVCCYKEGLTSQ